MIAIIGHDGFVGRALAAELTLRGIRWQFTGPAQTIVILAFRNGQTQQNIDVCQYALAGINRQAHVIYLSTDMVYPMGEDQITETTPYDLERSEYAQTHLTREGMCMLASDQTLIIRSTLIYGPGDNHNQYGPNRFMRQAKDGVIQVIGGGEEYRDQVYIKDVARLIADAIVNRVTGLVNLAAGTSVTQNTLAVCIADMMNAKIEYIPRIQPITHRFFDVSKLKQLFPGFCATGLIEGLNQSTRAI